MSTSSAPTSRRRLKATPISPHARNQRTNRSFHLPLTILILGVLVLYHQQNKITTTPALKSTSTVFSTSNPLPKRYAICTDGKKIYTVPPEDGGGIGEAECVVVINGKVVDTGSLGKVRRKYRYENHQVFKEDDIESVIGTSSPLKDPTGVYDMNAFISPDIHIIHLPKGYTVTPGLTDSHAHPLEYGHSRSLQLQGSKSIDEIVKKVEEYVKKVKPEKGVWVEGMGWDQNLWESKEFPTAADLDTPALRGIPISLKRIDVHAEWVSPAVLSLLPTSLPSNIPGGQVVRDRKGNPTGVFVDNAIDLIDKIRPKWTDEQRERYLELMVEDALQKGLVGVHDAGVLSDDLRFFDKMGAEGKLKMRFYSMFLCEDRQKFCGDRPKVESEDGRFKVQSVKLFGDGALGSRGAALIDDYSDKPGWKGFMLAPEETWAPLIKEYYDAGWQVNVHCIGDRANHVILNAMQHAIGSSHEEKEEGKKRRLRIEHSQVFTPDDMRRAVDMGVIASYQPTHATSDMWYAEDRLGSERIRMAYAWRTYLSLGGRITLGSDFPVESIDPLKGFYAAVTRRNEDGQSPHGSGGWYPEQKLNRVEALRGFTVDPAYASFSNDTGSLVPGMKFDAVIWDDDLMTVDEDDMLDVRVITTIIDGQIVYGKIPIA